MKNNKIIIYSFNSLAQQISKVLKESSYEIVIIEEDKELAKKAKDLGYEVKRISLVEDENIVKAGITNKDLKAFFCLGDDNNINLFITLSVRNLNKKLQIISISSDKQSDKTMFLAGANKVINPYEIGALRIARLLHKPLILKVLDNILFNESNIDIEEITIKENTILDGIYLDDLKKLNNKDIIILGIQDKELSDKFVFFSTGINHKIDAGDTLVILGKEKDLSKFRDYIHKII